MSGLEPLNVILNKITMADYDKFHYDKDLLVKSGTVVGNIEVNPIADLEQVRNMINKYIQETPDCPHLSTDWCFVDCEQYQNRCCRMFTKQ